MNFIKSIIALVYSRLVKGFFTKEYWVQEFSYAPYCFDCKEYAKGCCEICVTKGLQRPEKY